VKTIRFYCDEGLLQPVSLTDARYRLFDDSVFPELALIQRLRAMDLPLTTIGKFLNSRRSGLCTCSDLQATIRKKLAEIHERVDELHALESELSAMLNTWESCGRRSGPIRPEA
tara:strand:+ start:2424 stop:2765 length:342 start_codon:yes stop_codon:yes gene_type:complete